MSITPEVVKPEREVRFNEKIIWTLLALIVYYVMTVVPVYGVKATEEGTDPFFWLRTIMASQRGTLAELGIGPIVTAGLILQILTGSKIINVNMGDPEERSLYTGAQKVMAVFMTIFEGIAYILGGAYHGISFQNTPDTALLILAQLIAAGIMIILLDEMIQKGWGLGSGISLFIAGGVATQIAWGSVNLNKAPDGYYMGAVAATGEALSKDFPWGIQKVFFERKAEGELLELHQAVTTFAFLSTIIVFLIVIYFESMRIEIPLTYAKYRGFRGKYPIKLLYVSNIPVILVSAVFADLYFVVQMISNTWNKGGDNLFFNALGEYDRDNQPIGGLVYFLTPPRGIPAVANDPIRALVYGTIMVLLAIVFSLMWIETAGMGPRDVSRQLIQAGMAIPGWRRSQKIIEKRLNMYIPVAAFIGGAFIGVLAAGADFLGALGTGTGILLSVSICRQYFDILVKEKAADMHPALRDFLGIM